MPDIPVTYRTPFGLGPVADLRLPADLTLLEMAAAMPALPPEFMDEGIICINGAPVPRASWGGGLPRGPGVTEITFHASITGGGDDGGKNPLALIASIALLAAVGWVTGGGLASGLGRLSFGSAFAADTIGARIAGGLLAIGGQTLIAGLSPAPGVPGQTAMDAGRASGTASANGNVLRANGAVSRVLGARKVFPSFACQPFIYYDGDDEVVEAIYALSGPHEMTDLRFGDAAIDDMSGLTYEAREGWPGDARLTLVTRQTATDDVRAEARGFVLLDDGITVDDKAEDGFLPQPVVFATTDLADEYWLALSWPQGLHQQGDEDVKLRVPIRLRIRAAGTTTWANLPEIHYRGFSLTEIRTTIKFQWIDSPDVQVDAAAVTGFVEARKLSPGQTAAPAQDDFAAHASFGSGGEDYLLSGNLNTTGVANVVLRKSEAIITLDTASFSKGRYEIELLRGAAIPDADYVTADYEFDGAVWDLFGVQGEGVQAIVLKQSDIAAALLVVRGSSIWNDHPVPTDDFALIAVKARNRQLSPLSCTAKGYVQDWDGSTWANWTTTSNPAPHLRDVLAGALNANPVPETIIDDDDLVTWRTLCIAKGYEVNTIIEGGTVDSALALAAAAGFAAPRMSNTWGIVIGKDTSGDDPEFIFTPANSRDFGFSRSFPDPQDGFRAVFRDKDRDFAERQIVVPDSAIGGRLVQREYSEVTEADVRRRAEFDLGALRKQSTNYSLVAPLAAIAVRRGQLVGVEHDMLSKQTGQGRVIGWSESAGNLVNVTLDHAVQVTNEPDLHAVTDMHAITDLHAVGVTTGIVIVLPDGSTETHPLSTATGLTDTLTLATPAVSGVAEDLLVVVGPVGREFERLIVSDVTPQDEFSATVSFIDEAPELWA